MKNPYMYYRLQNNKSWMYYPTQPSAYIEEKTETHNVYVHMTS